MERTYRGTRGRQRRETGLEPLGQPGTPAGGPIDDHLPKLGARIRALRKERGFTLDDLGRLAGVTRSFLSQVENDTSSPSIQTLRNIALALDIPVFAFFDSQKDQRKKVVRKNDRKRIRTPHSHVEYELLSPDLQRNLEMIMMELEPGQVSAVRAMGHHGEECATVLSGQARVEVGEEHFDLQEGDTIHFQSDIPHRVLNPGKTKMRMISAITPPTF